MNGRTMHNPDACTACAVCVAHCPVAMATMRFRGPKLTGPAYQRFRLLGFGDEASLEYCSNCKNCDISCPSGVPAATFNMLARAAYCRENPPPFRDWILAHSGDLGALAAFVPPSLLNFAMENPLSRLLLHRIGIEKRAPLPRFASAKRRRALSSGRGVTVPGKTVVFFPGCFIRYYEPCVGLDFITLLEAAGYAVVVPENFSCCGLPLVAGGYADHALDKARSNSMELARWTKQNVPVITACPSCALMLTREYRELFPEENGLGAQDGAVIDACEFVAGLVASGELAFSPPKGGEKPRRVAYHAPCHLRARGAGRTGLNLLRMAPGLEVIDMDAGCCGISGSYGFKRGKYDIAMRVGAELFAALRDSGASLSASECGTCRVQIRHGGGIAAVHPLSIAASRVTGKEPAPSNT